MLAEWVSVADMIIYPSLSACSNSYELNELVVILITLCILILKQYKGLLGYPSEYQSMDMP